MTKYKMVAVAKKDHMTLSVASAVMERSIKDLVSEAVELLMDKYREDEAK